VSSDDNALLEQTLLLLAFLDRATAAVLFSSTGTTFVSVQRELRLDRTKREARCGGGGGGLVSCQIGWTKSGSSSPLSGRAAKVLGLELQSSRQGGCTGTKDQCPPPPPLPVAPPLRWAAAVIPWSLSPLGGSGVGVSVQCDSATPKA
jgi:hypothetical protein